MTLHYSKDEGKKWENTKHDVKKCGELRRFPLEFGVFLICCVSDDVVMDGTLEVCEETLLLMLEYADGSTIVGGE